MADIVLFHLPSGPTPGCRSFADALHAGGHAAATPDVYDGAAFTPVDNASGPAS